MKFTILLSISVLSYVSVVTAAVLPFPTPESPFSLTSLKEWADYISKDKSTQEAYEAVTAGVSICPPFKDVRIDVFKAEGEYSSYTYGGRIGMMHLIENPYTNKVENLNWMSFSYALEGGKCGYVDVRTKSVGPANSDKFVWQAPSYGQRVLIKDDSELEDDSEPEDGWDKPISFEELKISPEEAYEIAKKERPYIKEGFNSMELIRFAKEEIGTDQAVYSFSDIKGRPEYEEIYVGVTDGKIIIGRSSAENLLEDGTPRIYYGI